MPNTSIIQDGSQKYAIATPTFGVASNSYIVESFTRTDSSSRVDLNDGEGLPLGAVVVPGRVEVSLTVQVGGEDDGSRPKAGDALTHNSETVVITEVALAETQSDYRRYNISGYISTNTVTASFPS